MGSLLPAVSRLAAVVHLNVIVFESEVVVVVMAHKCSTEIGGQMNIHTHERIVRQAQATRS